MRITQIIAVITLVCSSTVHASLVSVSGDGEIISAPDNVFDDGAINTTMQGFNERQNFTTTEAHTIDGGGSIAAGTIVDSHMIFFNTVDNALGVTDATWTFSGAIIGIMSDGPGNLEAASFELGAAGTNYPGAFGARGLEGGDSLIFDALNPNQLTLHMRVREPGDWIRVITASTSAVPVPAAVWLFGTALLGFVGMSRKTKLS